MRTPAKPELGTKRSTFFLRESLALRPQRLPRPGAHRPTLVFGPSGSGVLFCFGRSRPEACQHSEAFNERSQELYERRNEEILLLRDLFLKLHLSREKPAILSSGSQPLGHLTSATIPESFIDTFIDQNAHLWTCEQKLFRYFERSDGRFARDGRKSL
jgi:hypothetical protein